MSTDQNIEQNNKPLEEIPGNIVTKTFQQRSDSAQEIISRRPGFVEKWALMMLLCILLLLVSGTWFIRYPDIVEARGTLTANNAPKEIIALQSGRL